MCRNIVYVGFEHVKLISDLPCSYEWTEMSTILALYCSLLSNVTTRPNISYDTNNDSYGQPMAQLYPLVFAAELPNLWRLALDLARGVMPQLSL